MYQATSKTLAMAISGVAGPSGSESKPVGLVYIGVKISYVVPRKLLNLTLETLKEIKFSKKV